MMWSGLINKYKEYLPINDNDKIISICEGNTPLIRAINLEKILEGLEIYIKFEGLNPTGSFKDRGMTMAVTKAVNDGSKAIICASTGNTSASAAAYAARAGIKCVVIVPNNKIAVGKLAQAMAYGAKIIAIDGNFDDALNIVKEISKKHPITLVNSVNPYRLEGQKTAAFEICDDLKVSPDYLCLPVGNAGNISAYWKGFKEYKENGKVNSLPKMVGYQAWGAAPLVDGKPVENPETIASAIRIGNPASWQLAENALKESDGFIDKLKDEDILSAYELVAKTEGIFAEPSSCISIAGLLKSYNEGKIKTGSKVVCILTGNGLKDPDTALTIDNKIIKLKCDISEIEKQIMGV